MRRLSLVILSVAFVALAFVVHAQTQAVTKTYLILAKGQGRGSTAFAGAVSAAGGTVTAALDEIGVVLAESSDPNFASRIGAKPGVQGVAEDSPVEWLGRERARQMSEVPRPFAGPPFAPNGEPYSGIQWSLRQIHADQAAAAGFMGSNLVRARVAVLDSGIVTDQPDLVPNLNLGLSTSFVPDEADLNPGADAFNHGTHVAGIVAAAVNHFGTQGVAPQAEIVAVKVLSQAGSGTFGWLIQGILYASGPAVRADVINMSLGTTFDRINQGGGGAGPLVAALNRAVDYATAAGTLCVSAAGNAGVNLNGRAWAIPAQSGNGLAVAATAPFGWALEGDAGSDWDRPASYTNYGRSVIGVAAPGGDALYPGDEACTVDGITNYCWVFDMVISPGGWTVANGSKRFVYYWASGTSMAAPHVSGLAALIVGAYGHMPPAQLAAWIEKSADEIGKRGADPYGGRGRINAARALGLQQEP